MRIVICYQLNNANSHISLITLCTMLGIFVLQHSSKYNFMKSEVCITRSIVCQSTSSQHKAKCHSHAMPFETTARWARKIPSKCIFRLNIVSRIIHLPIAFRHLPIRLGEGIHLCTVVDFHTFAISANLCKYIVSFRFYLSIRTAT